MKLKHLSASILIAVSSATMALPTTTTDLGVLNASGTQFEKSWIRLFGMGSTLGDFIDSYTFTLATAADAVGTVFKFDFGALDLLLNSVSLYRSGSTVGPTVASPDGFTFSGLGAGNYRLDVAGTVSSNGLFFETGGAYYQGTIQSFASPAPEPGSLAMFLAGLVAISSIVAARRKG